MEAIEECGRVGLGGEEVGEALERPEAALLQWWRVGGGEGGSVVVGGGWYDYYCNDIGSSFMFDRYVYIYMGCACRMYVYVRTSSSAVVSGGACGPARALAGEAALPSSDDDACMPCCVFFFVTSNDGGVECCVGRIN